MGIYEGEDKDIEAFNEKLLGGSGDSLRSKVHDTVDTVGDSLSSLWESASGGMGDLWGETGFAGTMGDVLAGWGFLGPQGPQGPHGAHASNRGPLTGFGDWEHTHGWPRLQAHRTPSDSQFMRCQDEKGLSVWDTRGWWRCLLPAAAMDSKLPGAKQLDSVLTRERVESDVHHNLGLFFTDYSRYLLWRSALLREAAERRKQQLARADAARAMRTTTPEDLMDFGNATTARSGEGANNVVGTSEYVTYNSTSDGQEQVKETKTFFADGSVRVRSETTKSSPEGKPHVECKEQMLSKDEAKDGWFWRK
ncbi:LAMI_0H10814g1_1 [Lachancea mirantina]|uniref:LAMI_0H10814g1_1 n=1 Tax=Lachancea mirantina TaxID=1230905 RepID=A0A1G4KH39_9SACH|nr:LAMI_0H10814g1_1 [Lachancea mirantina]